jgi:hypothetical protein
MYQPPCWLLLKSSLCCQMVLCLVQPMEELKDLELHASHETSVLQSLWKRIENTGQQLSTYVIGVHLPPLSPTLPPSSSFPWAMFFEPECTLCCDFILGANPKFLFGNGVLKTVLVCSWPPVSSPVHVPSALVCWFCSPRIGNFFLFGTAGDIWAALSVILGFSLFFTQVVHSFHVWFCC